MQLKSVLMEKDQMDRALTRIAHEILEKNRGIDDLAIIGIRRQGVPLAERLKDKIAAIEGEAPLYGTLDITSYRDDRQPDLAYTENHSEINFDVAHKKLVLVDDVLYTGRTVRAAIEAIFDLGRPRNIQLAILLDRGHREIPIRADYVGKNVPTSHLERVSVQLEETDGEDRVLLYEVNKE